MKRNLSILVILAMLSQGCTKNFPTINNNPNLPSTVTESVLLPSFIKKTEDAAVNESYYVGNVLAQYTAVGVSNDNAFDLYIFGRRDAIWTNFYDAMRDLNDMVGIAKANNHPNYQAIGLIYRSWLFGVLTDAYGDIPYSQALKAKSDNLNYPPYDHQQDIYTGILNDLKTANTLIDPTKETISGDILYNGDLTKWRKFANVLRLRYLLRISGKTDIRQQMQDIVNNPVQNPLFAKNADNAGLTYLTAAPNQFPTLLIKESNFSEARLCQVLGDTLLKYNDSRLGIWFQPTDNSVNTASPVYGDLAPGLSPNNVGTYKGGIGNLSKLNYANYYSSTFASVVISRGWIITLAEQDFILAEASARGYINGNTQNYYTAGIVAAFDQFGLTVPAGYMSQPGISYNAATALQQIGMQKWITLFFTGLEGWFETRRTDIPHLVPGPGTLFSQVPRRYQYPFSELNLNLSNVNQAVADQGADLETTPVWWNK